jgi:hypothetical protein
MQPQYSENHDVLSASQQVTFTIPEIVPSRPIGQSTTPQTKPNNSGYSIYAQQTIFHKSAKIPPRISLAHSNDTTTSTNTVKTWQMLHPPPSTHVLKMLILAHSPHSPLTGAGDRK